MCAEPARLAAFRSLATRGGGLSVLHWGMGTKPPENIGAFVELFGGCHGGPDRKFRVVTTSLRPASGGHAILRGVPPIDVHDEFYYRLKQPAASRPPTPLLEARIDETWETVSWAWQREDGGRSFGFSGLHFHKIGGTKRIVASCCRVCYGVWVWKSRSRECRSTSTRQYSHYPNAGRTRGATNVSTTLAFFHWIDRTKHFFKSWTAP